MNIINKISTAKKALGDALLDAEEGEFPYSFLFQENVPGKKFKITIEVVEEDFFIDKNGVKWVKSKDIDND